MSENDVISDEMVHHCVDDYQAPARALYNLIRLESLDALPDSALLSVAIESLYEPFEFDSISLPVQIGDDTHRLYAGRSDREDQPGLEYYAYIAEGDVTGPHPILRLRYSGLVLDQAVITIAGGFQQEVKVRVVDSIYAAIIFAQLRFAGGKSEG